MLLNSWLTGFIEGNGQFGIKIVEAKSDTRKRSVSYIISTIFRLDQRLIDKKTSLSMLPIMEDISKVLSCNLLTYVNKHNTKVLSLSVTSLDQAKVVINYFNIYPLLGTKKTDYVNWVQVYRLIVDKKHLTFKGRSEIKLIRSRINKTCISEQLILDSNINFFFYKKYFIYLVTLYILYILYTYIWT